MSITLSIPLPVKIVNQFVVDVLSSCSTKPTLYSCRRLFHFLMIFEIGKGTLSSRSTTLQIGKQNKEQTNQKYEVESTANIKTTIKDT